MSFVTAAAAAAAATAATDGRSMQLTAIDAWTCTSVQATTYAAVTTTIRLFFNGRSTGVRLLIKGH